MRLMPDRGLGRTAVRKIKPGEEGSDVAYWRSRPPGWPRSKNFDANITAGPIEIDPNFREFAACADVRDVRFLIVGGRAVGFHSHPRYTKDLDVWVERTPERERAKASRSAIRE